MSDERLLHEYIHFGSEINNRVFLSLGEDS